MRLSCLIVVLATGVAAADPPHPVVRMFHGLPPSPDGPVSMEAGPAFAFGPEEVALGGNREQAVGAFAQFNFELRQPIVGVARDGKAAWVAGEVDVWMPLTSKADDVPNGKADGSFHATALVDGGPAWRWVMWVMWHTGWTALHKEPRPKWVAKLPPLAEQIRADAAPVVALAKAALADPKQLAAAVDERKDAVLLGSERKERFVGAAEVRAALLRWKLAFQVRDGIQAGLTRSKTVAWVAANVDARPHDKPRAKATPYRVTMLYEKSGAAWKLVVLQFSSVPVQ